MRRWCSTYIRLLFVSPLQCVVDIRFIVKQWELLISKNALDAITKLVLQTLNKVVH